MELHEALVQISEIRAQVARSETFRGFKPLPVALSGLLAWATALVQSVWLPEPSRLIDTYLILWGGAAVLSLGFTGLCVALHCWHARSAMTRTSALLAIGQFVPCLIAGTTVTWVLYFKAPEILWTLPGLWSILFSLGIFACHRLLPRATIWVAAYYLLAGALTLALAQDGEAFSPWAMALPFGLGQFLAAAVLYWSEEVDHV